MFHCNSHYASIAFGWFRLTLHEVDVSHTSCILLLWDEVQSLMSFLISLSFLPSRAKEFHFQCHPLVMVSLCGLLILVWGIALWSAVGALNAASAFSFPQTLTCPGTQHRSMIIQYYLLRLFELVLWFQPKLDKKKNLISVPREHF